MPDEFIPPKTVKPSGITPQQPKTPPKEVMESNFQLDDKVTFGDGTTGAITAPIQLPEVKPESKPAGQTIDVREDAHKRTEDKKLETKKEEPKTEVQPILRPPKGKETEQKVDSKGKTEQIKLPKKEDKPRDYTGYTPEEIEIFKQMSHPAFEFVDKTLKKNKELMNRGSEQFFQHPQAFILSPDYQKTQVDLHLANREAQYWQQHLESAISGKPFKQIIGWKDGTLEPIFSDQEIVPNQRIEEACRQSLIKCNGVVDQLKSKMNGFGSEYKQRIDTDLKMINAERANRFEWVQNPELMDYEIDTDNGPKSLKVIKNDFKSIFPPYLRDNPGVEVASDLLIALVIAKQESARATAGQRTAEIKQEEVQRGEPSSTTKPREPVGEEIGGVRNFSLADMPT